MFRRLALLNIGRIVSAMRRWIEARLLGSSLGVARNWDGLEERDPGGVVGLSLDASDRWVAARIG